MAAPINVADCRLGEDGLLSTPAGEQQLRPRLAKILRALIDARGVAVSSEYLLDSCWGAGGGSPQYLPKAIFQLRHALAGSSAVRIQSVYGYGYRLHLEAPAADRPDSATIVRALCEEAALRLHDRRSVALKAAQSIYQQATQLDPGCILALLGYASATLQLLISGYVPTAVAWPAARQAIVDALEIEPLCVEALAYRGLGECVFEWDFKTSEATLEAAHRLGPQSFPVCEMTARAWLFRGHPDRAIDQLHGALAANPVAMSANGLLAVALGASGDATAALNQIGLMSRLDPSSQVTPTYKAWLEAIFGDADEAGRFAAEIVERAPDSSVATSVHAVALARAGNAVAARAVLDTLEDQNVFAAPNCALAAYAWRTLGDHDAAVGTLAAAAESRDYWLGFALNDPLNAELREHPGFDAVYGTVFGACH